MKCLILAAGYATRLYPLTQNFPKPLLEIKGKTIIDWLIDDLNKRKMIDEYIVITNHKFYEHFNNWSKNKDYKVRIVDDGTESNENRLGAVKDIALAIDQLQLDDDMLVLAGDNVLDFSLSKFIDYALDKKTTCVMRYFEEDKKRLTKSGILQLDGDKVIDMQEKPKEPKSQWCCPPFYFYLKKDSKLIQEAINSNCEVDAPGSFIAWLIKKAPVYAYEMPGKRYDVGNIDSYRKVQDEYEGIKEC